MAHKEQQGINLQALASIRTSADVERAQRQMRLALWAALLLFAIVLSPALAVNFSNALSAIRQGDWWGFFQSIPLFFTLLGFLLALPAARILWALVLAVPGKTLELRQQFLSERLAPPAADQPAILQGEALPYTATRIGPLKHWKPSMIVSIIFGCFFLLLGSGVAWVLIWLLTNPATGFHPGLAFPLAEVIFSILALSTAILICCGLGIALLIAAARAPRGATVTADDWGLRWRKGGSGQRSRAALAWSDVQGFYRVTYQDKKAGDYHAYLLDGRETAFHWRLIPRSTPAERAASQRLASLIVTRSRQPLRDLTGLLTAALDPEPEPAVIAAPADATLP